MTKLEKLIGFEISGCIKDFEGVYICDLAYEIYNSGYFAYNKEEARDTIVQNIDDVLEVVKEYQVEFGEPFHAINDYESLMNLAEIQVAQKILKNLNCVQVYWDEKLSPFTIELIQKELEEKIY